MSNKNKENDMKTMTEYKHLVDKEFASKPRHTRYCPGIPQASQFHDINKKYGEALQSVGNGKGDTREWIKKMDSAWTVCLLKAGIIEKELAIKLLKAIEATGGSESTLIEYFDNEDLGSVVNYGRTLQEPMSRLQMRDTALGLFEDILKLLDNILDVAEKNIDAIMPGHTHLSQAQPITLAHYLLSIYDGIERGLKQFELGYLDTNRNSGGCGACSGIAWPVDRWLLTDLLGFDDLVESTYDCESAQDHSMTLMFALSNIVLLISKVSMDMNIWGMEEIGMLHSDPRWCGVSSMMPQKCIPGSQLERARIGACDVIGEMIKGVTLIKGEPHADMLPMLRLPARTLTAMANASYSISMFSTHLEFISPQKEEMLKYVKEGFSCATEIVVYMIKELGYGGRRSHRIVANFVRMARERKLTADQTSGELLDEAARFAGEKEPGINTETLRKLLDPVEFIKSHNNTGGTAPEEAKRMINARRKKQTSNKQRNEDRKAKLSKGEKLLQKEISEILNS
jgi:argininosuccinate lyase